MIVKALTGFETLSVLLLDLKFQNHNGINGFSFIRRNLYGNSKFVLLKNNCRLVLKKICFADFFPKVTEQ